ncbi:DUF3105 domain-containing protein [Actinocorallia sp. A-T 12471]|uniref:DUF3105 domain-containing protein n=1 Tax=Actinocorallia sp. A-T 12471 TaxID=3089813 RepID=UPI0029CE6989|nr:DUF3105 domain-containing protein [Actinocorallia sp. A-T 12471]MDX6739422.1 DUF3105 domain-containing protein [Actinocorallia sp. A-T 12471]
MSPSQKSAREARQRVAEMRAKEKRRERRNKVLGVSAAGVVAAALVAGAVWMVTQQESAPPVKSAPVTSKVRDDGVTIYEGLTANHVTKDVAYGQTPPVGGDHNAVWQNCGIYGDPLKDVNAVHSLEHGAVWITYGKGLAEAQVTALRDLVRGKPYVLLSPHDGVADGIFASAWGAQLKVTDPADAKLTAFITEFAQSPNAPEPGAPCTSGTGQPQD